MLEGERRRIAYEAVTADLRDTSVRRALFSQLAKTATHVLVRTEGLLGFFYSDRGRNRYFIHEGTDSKGLLLRAGPEPCTLTVNVDGKCEHAAIGTGADNDARLNFHRRINRRSRGLLDKSNV
jgi:hypothetical protein